MFRTTSKSFSISPSIHSSPLATLMRVEKVASGPSNPSSRSWWHFKRVRKRRSNCASSSAAAMSAAPRSDSPCKRVSNSFKSCGSSAWVRGFFGICAQSLRCMAAPIAGLPTPNVEAQPTLGAQRKAVGWSAKLARQNSEQTECREQTAKPKSSVLDMSNKNCWKKPEFPRTNRCMRELIKGFEKRNTACDQPSCRTSYKK